jgi:hypothetical protein
MAKFHGVVGYVQTEETSPGVFSEVVTERACKGDLLRNTQSWESGEHLNPNFNISNRFSIVADAYAYENLEHIRYIQWMGCTKWSVSGVEIQRPRLILSVNGVYNE